MNNQGLTFGKNFVAVWPLSQLRGARLLFRTIEVVPFCGVSTYQGSQLSRGKYVMTCRVFRGMEKWSHLEGVPVNWSPSGNKYTVLASFLRVPPPPPPPVLFMKMNNMQENK